MITASTTRHDADLTGCTLIAGQISPARQNLTALSHDRSGDVGVEKLAQLLQGQGDVDKRLAQQHHGDRMELKGNRTERKGFLQAGPLKGSRHDVGARLC